MLTKFLCKRPAGCQCLLPRPGRQAGLSLMCVIHQSKITCVPKKGTACRQITACSKLLTCRGKKKYNPLFSSPPRSRCLIQRINTEKSNYSCRTRETQLQHSTSLAPAGGCGVATLCHIPAGSAHGLCCTGQASPPGCTRDPARGAAPRPSCSAPKHRGPQRRGDGWEG